MGSMGCENRITACQGGTRYLVLSTQYASAAPLLAVVLLLSGCHRDETSVGQVEAVWGRFGYSEGRFETPRAIAIDRDDHLYIVDKTARIQVFTADGKFIRQWSTPDHAHGKPTGLSIDRDGNVLVADTHYFQVLVYSPEGKLLRTLGGKKGEKPGEFGLVTGTAQDSQGNIYIAEYGEFDRIQKFKPDGRTFMLQWGGHGSEPGQFIRPQKIVFDDQDHLWVTDPVITAFRSSIRKASFSKSGGARVMQRANFIILMTWPWGRTTRSMCASMAIIAFRSLRAMAKASPVGEPRAAAWGNFLTPGGLFAIATERSMCLIRIITACSGS